MGSDSIIDIISYYIDSICADGDNFVYRSLAMTVKYTILSSKIRVHGNPF